MASRTASPQQLGIDPADVRVGQPLSSAAPSARKGSLTPRTGADRARGEAAEPAGEAGRDPRPGLHHRDLPRRDAPPHPPRRRRATASSSATATRAGRSPRGPTPTSSPAPRTARGSTPSPNVCDQASTIVHADRNTPGFMRSPPEVPYIFALESAMDELAVKLGMDPIELRRVNDTTKDPIKGMPFSSRSLMQCFDEAAERVRLEAARPAARLDARRRLAGRLGLRHARSTRPMSAPATARVRLTPNGQVARADGGARDRHRRLHRDRPDGGRASSACRSARSTVELGDSALPPAPVAGGSNTTASVCNAVMKACDAIRDRLAARRRPQTTGRSRAATRPP